MSEEVGQKGKSADNSKFPVKIEYFSQINGDPKFNGYFEYVVIANGFVIAHFVSERDMMSYKQLVDAHGLGHLPAKILEILRHNQDVAGGTKKLLTPND